MQVVTESQPARTSVANPLLELRRYGQSVWLDYIRRHLITSGELQHLVDEDGLSGVTSNPSIFEKAVTGSTDYDDILSAAAKRGERDPAAVYETLVVRDIQSAAEVFRPLYEQAQRRDGYVSLEVSPLLAHDTQRTVAEARRLWKEVGRDNVLIKVPGTREGVPAIRQLISEGINVNVTLLFAREMYEQVAEAYLAGLEQFAARGGDLARVASVASFFVSRIDTAVDKIVGERLKTAGGGSGQAKLRWLLGKVAIANAKLAYQIYKDIVRSPRWHNLARKGAAPQRLLWASTSTKNPNYRDVLYVEELIGPDTVNTMPPVTMDAFRDHGRTRPSLEEDIEDAREVIETLGEVGISLTEVTQKVLDDGVRLFAESFERLLAAIREKIKGAQRSATDRMSHHLPEALTADVADALRSWQTECKVRRLWARDPSLWTNRDEGRWLDWLAVTEDQRTDAGRFRALGDEVRAAGLRHAVLLGMGGSSLCPEVLARIFGAQPGHPKLFALDSTDPEEIRALENQIDLAKTLFIVSSKSGTTLEPNIFKDYFFDRVRAAIGAEVGQRFIAITDPGSKLERIAEDDRFRSLFHGVPGIGGRYSALSDFGLIPAAIMGLDVPRLLETAEEMVQACRSCVPAQENPGVVLGVIMGVLARNGRDKVTLIASPAIAHLGAWLEQLLAESTGKDGDGLIPVDREPLGPPEVYGDDRLFVYLRLNSAADSGQDAAVDALQRAGQPVVRIAIADTYALGQEFFRWEMATAVAGSVMGINPFNQPDVESAKLEARKLTAAFEERGALPPERPILRLEDFNLYADDKNAVALTRATGKDRSPRAFLKAHLDRLGSGDYFAVLAFVERNAAHADQLDAMRRIVRDSKHVATCAGFGPRYLHSTGQVYKGGPNTGVFLLITHEQAADLPVPGHKFGFGVVEAAQARGDFQVLAQRDRRILRVHLGPEVSAGLGRLQELLREAVQ